MVRDVRADGFKEAPYWWDLAPRPKVTDEPSPATADVVIVGSGNVGLSVALTLTRRGREVVIIDAEALGHGASTRNAGYLGRNVWYKYGDMVAKVGREEAGRITREAIFAHDYAARLIREEQIACHYRDSGRFIAAPSKTMFDKMAKDLDVMREDGIPVDAEMVGPDEQPGNFRKGLYWGGQILRGNGVIHAGLYHQGLLDRVVGQGARVFGNCPAEIIERDGIGFRIRTPRGTIRAAKVVVATNGYTRKTTGWLRRRVVPVDAYMIATEPLPAELMDRVLPERRPVLENRYNPCWIRANEDGTRILFGGASAEKPFHLPDKAKALHDIMVSIAPDLRDVKLTHCWTGKTAFTFDMLPHTGNWDGIEYAAGWCGAGVPMGTWLGHKTALRILGDPEGATAFDNRPFPGKPFYTGNPWMLPLLVSWYRRKDRQLFKG